MRADEFAESIFLQGDAIASKGDAEAGTNNTKLMTPLRVAEALNELAGGELASMQSFTASGTWTRPAGITRVKIIVTGGGEGGDSSPAERGDAAGTAIKVLDVSAISTATITIGGAGSNNRQNRNWR